MLSSQAVIATPSSWLPITRGFYPVRAGRDGPYRASRDLEQVADFIAWRGDPSDELPGERGVVPKGAVELPKRYDPFENTPAAGRFPT
jgi:hypothetical protein